MLDNEETDRHAASELLVFGGVLEHGCETLSSPNRSSRTLLTYHRRLHPRLSSISIFLRRRLERSAAHDERLGVVHSEFELVRKEGFEVEKGRDEL